MCNSCVGLFILQELSDQTGREFDNTTVRWVITVPAIWKMPAKQFMREAAYKVGKKYLHVHVFQNNICFQAADKVSLLKQLGKDSFWILN